MAKAQIFCVEILQQIFQHFLLQDLYIYFNQPEFEFIRYCFHNRPVSEWSDLCRSKILSMDFIDCFSEYIVWKDLITRELPIDYLFKYKNEIELHNLWDKILNYQKLPEIFIEKYIKKFNLSKLREQKLSTSFIRRNIEYLNYKEISKKELSLTELRDLKDILHWKIVSGWSNLLKKDVNIVTEFQNQINWEILSNRYLSIDIYRKFQHLINWSRYGVTTGLIRTILHSKLRFLKRKDMIYLCLSKQTLQKKYPKLSEELIIEIYTETNKIIEEFKDYINWKEISLMYRIDQDFIDKYHNRLIMDYVSPFLDYEFF